MADPLEQTTEGWRLMREKKTGRIIGMRYVADACDGGAWFVRGSQTPIHPDTVYHDWEPAIDG